MVSRQKLIALTLFAIPGAVIGQSGQDERAREANRKDTNVFVREARAGESSGLAPWEIAGRLVGGAFATQQDSERGILENIRAGDEIAFSKAPGTAQMDQAVAYYRQALATAEQQRPPHRPDNMAKCRYRLACGLRERGLTRSWGVATRQADLNEAKTLFESITTDFPTSRESPHGYVPRGKIEVELLGPSGTVTAVEAAAAAARSDAIYERLRFDYPEYRLWGEDAITGTNHAAPPVATVADEVVYHLKNRVWARTYGSGAADEANSVQPTWDGGFVAAGYSGNLAWVLKLADDGDVAWQKTFGGGVNEQALAIRPTDDTGFVVAALTQSFGAGGQDAWVVRLGSDGAVIWQKAYGGPGTDGFNSIVPAGDGGFFAAGETTSWGAGGLDAWIVKLDGRGLVTWQRTIGGPGVDQALSVAPTSDAGCIVAGWTNSFGAGGYDAWLLKLDSAGNVVWQKTVGGPSVDRAISVRPTADGGYLVAGHTNSFGAGAYDVWLLKLDRDGGLVTQTTCGGAAADYIQGPLEPAGDDEFLVTGGTGSFGAGQDDLWALRVRGDGTIASQMAYGTTGDESGRAIGPAADGGLAICGATSSAGSGGLDLWIVKAASDGSVSGSGESPPPGLGVATTAVPRASTAVAQDSNALVRDSAASVVDTAAEVKATNATVCQQAPLTWSPPRR